MQTWGMNYKSARNKAQV